jgi:uroporphyrinogen-III synthase
VNLPCVRCEAAALAPDDRALLRSVGAGDVVIVTSVNGARYYAAAGGALSPDAVFVAASPGLRDKVAQLPGFDGLRVEAPTGSGAAGARPLVNWLAKLPFDRRPRMILPRARLADDELPTRFAEAGFEAHPVIAYETRPMPLSPDHAGLLQTGDYDIALYMAGSCVDAVAAAGLLRPTVEKPTDRLALVGAIGDKTARALRAHGMVPDLLAPEPTLPALVAATLLKLDLAA